MLPATSCTLPALLLEDDPAITRIAPAFPYVAEPVMTDTLPDDEEFGDIIATSPDSPELAMLPPDCRSTAPPFPLDEFPPEIPIEPPSDRLLAALPAYMRMAPGETVLSLCEPIASPALNTESPAPPCLPYALPEATRTVPERVLVPFTCPETNDTCPEALPCDPDATSTAPD